MCYLEGIKIKRVLILLIMLILSSILSVGCIVINTDKNSSKEDDKNVKETIREVIIKDNSSNNNTTTNNNTNNDINTSHGDFIFYDSDVRYLSGSELAGLSNWQLRIARNEIYARHGRLFKDDDLQNYFNSCSWYYGYISPDSFNNNVLNEVEVYNVNLIKQYE